MFCVGATSNKVVIVTELFELCYYIGHTFHMDMKLPVELLTNRN